jgi:hypothetical protein
MLPIGANFSTAMTPSPYALRSTEVDRERRRYGKSAVELKTARTSDVVTLSLAEERSIVDKLLSIDPSCAINLFLD